MALTRRILVAMMRTLRALLHRQRPAPAARSSRTNIAVLEYDLYGIPPQPNTMAALAVGLRALSNAGATSRETLAPMTHCTATGSILLDGQPTVVVCDRVPHDDNQHNDAILGDWDSEE